MEFHFPRWGWSFAGHGLGFQCRNHWFDLAVKHHVRVRVELAIVCLRCGSGVYAAMDAGVDEGFHS